MIQNPTYNKLLLSVPGIFDLKRFLFKVLLQDSFSWREASNGRVPSGAVKIGTTPFGETLYFGRKTYNGYTTPGKVSTILFIAGI